MLVVLPAVIPFAGPLNPITAYPCVFALCAASALEVSYHWLDAFVVKAPVVVISGAVSRCITQFASEMPVTNVRPLLSYHALFGGVESTSFVTDGPLLTTLPGSAAYTGIILNTISITLKKIDIISCIRLMSFIFFIFCITIFSFVFFYHDRVSIVYIIYYINTHL